MERFDYKEEELNYAIKWALTLPINFELSNQRRISFLNHACVQAFVDNLSGPNCDILRQAIKDLEDSGHFIFKQ